MLNALQSISTESFPSCPCHFTLSHHDLPLDPVMHEVTGIVDWECGGARPRWGGTYPVFLFGSKIEGGLVLGDTDERTADHWENWVIHFTNSMQKAWWGRSLGSNWIGWGFRMDHSEQTTILSTDVPRSVCGLSFVLCLPNIQHHRAQPGLESTVQVEQENYSGLLEVAFDWKEVVSVGKPLSDTETRLDAGYRPGTPHYPQWIARQILSFLAASLT